MDTHTNNNAGGILSSNQIILVAETGADIPPSLAEKYGIHITPMHVTFDTVTKADGSFDPDEIIRYFEETGKVPMTSGCSQHDFEVVFDRIHEQYPKARILYMAYSAVTTCSFASAKLAAEGRDYIAAVDTKQVTIGQGACVIRTARAIRNHPEWTLAEAASYAETVSSSMRMCFLPNKLDFLRAGGRVKTATALCGNLLHIHPCIDVTDGFLLAGKKYRGSLQKVIPQLIRDHVERFHLDRKEIWFAFSPRLSEDLKQLALKIAGSLGFEQAHMVPTGGVISSHGGPNAIAIGGFTD